MRAAGRGDGVGGRLQVGRTRTPRAREQGVANSGEPPEPSLRTRYIKPLSVTWVPSPDAYSSRNAVSLALAAVFLTAAKALGSSNARTASFIVDLRARQHVENVPAANLQN